MSAPDPKLIPFNTLVTLLRIGATKNGAYGVRYRLPDRMLNVRLMDSPLSLSDWEPNEGVLQPHEALALALPHIEMVQKYRDETAKAVAEVKDLRELHKRMIEEINHLRCVVYGPDHYRHLEEYEEPTP